MILSDAETVGAKPSMGLWHLLGVRNYAMHSIKFRTSTGQNTFGTTHGRHS